MPRSAQIAPKTDPTPIFEHFRGNLGSELLVAAVGHLDVFGKLGESGKSSEALRESLGMADRPFCVLITALRAMGMLTRDEAGVIAPTPLAAEHLSPGGEFDVSGYLGLSAQTPGVLAMVERLRTNRPAGAEDAAKGAAFIFREGVESAMEREDSARALTLALAGRAKNVAPVLARNVPLGDARLLLDVGGGTGIYSIAYLQAHPNLRAIVWDRPEVLKVAREMAESHGVGDRLQLIPGDMFSDPAPTGADAVLLSNILHDWDVAECRSLVGKLASAMDPRGQLLIHDAFLDDDLGGPLPVALYSASLFSLTEGRPTARPSTAPGWWRPDSAWKRRSPR